MSIDRYPFTFAFKLSSTWNMTWMKMPALALLWFTWLLRVYTVSNPNAFPILSCPMSLTFNVLEIFTNLLNGCFPSEEPQTVPIG